MVFSGYTQIYLLLVSLVFSRLGFCDVEMVKPQTGVSYTVSGGSASIDVVWEDDDVEPKLSDVKYYTFTLCSGPNSNIEAISTLAKKIEASSISDNSYTVTVPSDVSEDGTYFIQVLALGDFGYTIHYSGRFSLSGMSGTIVASGAGDISTPPAPQYMITAGPGATGVINSASFTIPYPKQSGISKFAPMQSQPGTSVDFSKLTTWSRRFPTSGVTYYTSYATSRDCKTTITPGWSYTMTSEINYQTANAGPASNGGWYNPSKRMTLSTRKINAKALGASAQATST